MTDTTQITVIPWYQSKVLQGILVTLVTQILAKLHVASAFTDTDISTYVDDFLELVSFAAAAWAGYRRLKNPTPPLAPSKAKAAAANAAPLVMPPTQ